jgi:large subunit ribosomal protein L3
MAKGHKPVAGSRAYWPKKRAKRIYPRLKAKTSDQAVPLGFGGYKAGMTQIVYTDTRKGSPTEGREITKAATVLDCPSLVVAGIRTYKKTHNGLKALHTVWSEKPSKDLNRRGTVPKKQDQAKVSDIESQVEKIDDIRLLVHSKPRESGIGKKKPEVFEIPIGGEPGQKWEYAKGKLGQELKASEVFSEGEYLDPSAVSKGKGFQGPVKRFGIKVRPRKHEKKRRHTGVLGVRNVARVLPGKIAMAGQLGFQSRTEYNKRVLKIASGELSPSGGWVNYGMVKGDYMIVEGSIPGPRKRFIVLRKGIRSPKTDPVEVRTVILSSQQ